MPVKKKIEKAAEPKNTIKVAAGVKEIPEPLMASLKEDFSYVSASECDTSSGTTRLRRNRASSIAKLDRFSNLESGAAPFIYNTGKGNYDENISAKDTIILCQKAYWNVPIFRNTIDLMTEFSMSKIYLTGGNEQSRKFFNLWLEKIDYWELQDQFYREFYRSGNVFLYKFSADFGRDTMMKIQEAFGSVLEAKDSSNSIPIKYILLNPADINIIASSSFLDGVYVKSLNDYEIQSLLNPKTEEEKALLDKIPEIKKLWTDKKNKKASGGKAFSGLQNIQLNLEKEKLITVFYKKQTYEPLSVPMGFPVLEDINSKLELKKIDQAIARSVQQAVLLITMGDEKVGMPSEKNLSAMRRLFENQSVGKVLVADYTTDAKFIIPDIGSLLDPRKYEILDEDIRMGLNNILFGDEKFSNTSIKVKVFFARLKYGREKFLKNFLIPEMKQIGKKLGFKNIPEPKLEDVDFEDNVLMSRVYSRLTELGVLTPEEALTVFETGRLPSPDESVESQVKFKTLREKGYYQPLIGGGKESEGEQEKQAPKQANVLTVGRPSGINTKQSKERASASEMNFENENKFSCMKMKNTMSCISNLEKKAQYLLKKKFKINKLSEYQEEVASDLAFAVASNEEIDAWDNRIDFYIENPGSENIEIRNKILDLSANHCLDHKSATILYHSRI
jgi:hypothetical protein